MTKLTPEQQPLTTDREGTSIMASESVLPDDQPDNLRAEAHEARLRDQIDDFGLSLVKLHTRDLELNFFIICRHTSMRVEVVSAAMTIEEVETWVAGAHAARFAMNVLYHKEKEYNHFSSVWLFGAQAMLDQIKRNRER